MNDDKNKDNHVDTEETIHPISTMEFSMFVVLVVISLATSSFIVASILDKLS